MTTGQENVARSMDKLKGGGLCATPLLPTICPEDYMRRRRLNQALPDAQRRMVKRPAWLTQQANC